MTWQGWIILALAIGVPVALCFTSFWYDSGLLWLLFWIALLWELGGAILLLNAMNTDI